MADDLGAAEFIVKYCARALLEMCAIMKRGLSEYCVSTKEID